MVNKQQAQLAVQARAIRCSILEMIANSGSSHIAAAFSIVDILVALYFNVLHIDPKKPNWDKRDRFLLSKGHGGAALYATLAHRGFADLTELKKYAQADSAMAGHIVRNSLPGVETTAGSLGHGLSMGLGIALTLKKSSLKSRVFVLVGDGECNEGSIWEAALVAAHFKLGNLTLIVDKNNQQSMGSSKEVMNMNPFADKWRAFGWNAVESNGHNFMELCKSLRQKVSGRPTVIIAKTIKGKGVSFMEANPLDWHYKTPKDDLLLKAREELNNHA